MITKEQNKQLIVKNTKTTYQCDTIVADDTNSMKLVLWEDMIDKVLTGRCYHFTNLTVRIFDDVKFVNTNELSVIKEIEEIPNVKMDAPDIKDNLVMGQVVGVNIKRSPSCMACNETLSPPEDEEEDITCKNCNFTTLPSLCNIKLVAQLVIKTPKELLTLTCFNDAIQSFLKNTRCSKSLKEISQSELKHLFLTAGQQQLVIDKTTKIIAQFLPIK